MKILFWAVDCQKDFMNKDGALYVEGAESIKPNLKILTDFAREYDITVVNTKDCHSPEDVEISDNPDFINTFPRHCIFYEDGIKFIKEVRLFQENEDFTEIDTTSKNPKIHLYDRNFIIEKDKFDVFEGNKHTERLLEILNPDLVVVYGVATNVCVNYAVLGLKKRGYDVLVVEDAIKELPQLDTKIIFDSWVENRVTKASTEEILEYIEVRLS